MKSPNIADETEAGLSLQISVAGDDDSLAAPLNVRLAVDHHQLVGGLYKRAFLRPNGIARLP